MPEIVLTTLNARYAHCAFGLRYLMANLGALRERAEVVEFDVGQRSTDVIEGILQREPKVVGVGVYIWNAEKSLQVVAELKRLRPEIRVVVGGPEVSYEVQEQEITQLADYVVTGEADLAFARLCGQLLGEGGGLPLQKVIAAELPAMEELVLPYGLYDQKDIAHRVIYVEASRGCPFKCEFCLSSLDVPVRNVPIEKFLGAMQGLLDRGAKRFKFVDRTFNLNAAIGKAILEFFLDRYEPGMFLHFEMIPDRLPEGLREPIRGFPKGALQFEVGIQTFNEAVSERISRRQDPRKIEENLTFLRQQTGVHVHADLIVGLPGEDEASFGAGFDRLVGLGPQEIQVGMLKRLRGTPIIRHDAEWGMVYSPKPPYEILQNRSIDFSAMQRLRRFSRYWDLVANSGNFRETGPLIWGDRSAFTGFMRFSDWLYGRVGRGHGIALSRLMELVFEYLTAELGQEKRHVATTMWRDYQRGGRSDKPVFLRGLVEDGSVGPRVVVNAVEVPKRQARHMK